jgi:GIY-YIG catalytic domain
LVSNNTLSGTSRNSAATEQVSTTENTQVRSFTLNLSSLQLSTHELSLLNKGLTFIPTYNSLPINDIYCFQNRLIRNLKLKDYFQDDTADVFDYSKKTFTHPSTWTPPDHKVTQTTLSTIQDIMNATERLIMKYTVSNGRLMIRNEQTDNLTKHEKNALKSLQNNRSIVIKPADKGSATVVLNKEAYLQEAYRQLDNGNYYRKLDAPIYPNNISRINEILEEMEAAKIISRKQLAFLQARDTDRARVFYLLPKIHKPREKWPQPNLMPEGRPIVSDCSSESYRISQYIDSFIRPISILHPSYIKDTYDFVSKIRYQRIPKNAVLVTGDVSALYTNMKLDRVMTATREALRKHPEPDRPDAHLLRLLELTLKNNDFEFNGQFYLQICGTAMGKTYAPGLADIYLEQFDEKARTGYHIKPLLFYRFLDDIFFVWTGSMEELKEYEQYLNSLIDGITITLCSSDVCVDFLDTTVYKYEENENTTVLHTKVFFKPTDTHQLLEKSSFHPRHVAKGVLKSQVLRFKRISTSYEDFCNACNILFKSLALRNYSRRMMRKMKTDVWNAHDRRHDTGTEHTNAKPLPIVIQYNELGTKLANHWKNSIKNNTLFDNYRLITAFCTGQNLRRKLVHSKLDVEPPTRTPALNTRHIGCIRCVNTRCKACNYITTGKTITSNTNKKQFSIIGNINCKTCNIVYVITCRKCKLQYVGETGRPLADRINDHLSNIRNRKETPVGLHFNTPSHTIQHFSIMGIEHIAQSATTSEVQKMKETTWQNLLQTAYPLGINNLKRWYINVP